MTVTEYYHKKFGIPSREAEFIENTGKKIEIYKWDENLTDEEVVIYATGGASTILGTSETSCEFFIGLTPQVDDIAQALAEVALHGSGNSDIPKPGDTTTLTYPLWRGTNASAFLFTEGDEIIWPTRIGNKNIVFLQLVPIFPAEIEYKKVNGVEALWSAFESLQVPYWDSRREQAF